MPGYQTMLLPLIIKQPAVTPFPSITKSLAHHSGIICDFFFFWAADAFYGWRLISSQSLFIKGNNAWYIYLSESLYLKFIISTSHPQKYTFFRRLKSINFWAALEKIFLCPDRFLDLNKSARSTPVWREIKAVSGWHEDSTKHYK